MLSHDEWQIIAQAVFELENSDKFLQYTNVLSDSLCTVIKQDYEQGANEPTIVKDISKAINLVKTVPERLESGLMFSYNINSAFIHGKKSFVEFSLAGSKECCELGDIVFVSSLAWRGKIVAERITINQVKKEKPQSKSSWEINKTQLFLLTRFPTFKGVSGIFNGDTVNAVNETGCLGSYGFLKYSDDLAFVGSIILDACLGGESTLKKDSFLCFHLLDKLSNIGSIGFSPFYFRSRFWSYSVEYCPNIYDFVRYYCRLLIGEPVCGYYGFNSSIKSLVDIIKNFANKKAKEDKTSKELQALVTSFSMFPYAYQETSGNKNGRVIEDNPSIEIETGEDGGHAIIHSIIDIGERI